MCQEGGLDILDFVSYFRFNMAKIYIVNGVPVVMTKENPHIRTFRLKAIPRKIRDKPLHKLNDMQRRALEIHVIKNKADPKLKVASGIEAGFSPSYAGQAVSELMKRKEIVYELEKMGINNQTIAGAIKDGLEAMHPLAKIPAPDHHARHKFVAETNKLLDNYPSKKIEIKEEKAVLHLTLDDMKSLKEFSDLRRADET